MSKQDGSHPVALWSKPPTSTERGGDRRASTGAANPDHFELPGPRDHASAPECRIEAQAHDRMIDFNYDPAGVHPALWLALSTLACLAAVLGQAARQRPAKC